MRILITGATGNLGRKLRSHFAANSSFHLIATCLNPSGEAGVETADLSIYDESWARLFSGVDAVVHLAGDPKPSAGWDSIQRANIDLTMNVFEAARRHGVARIVFASSNWVMAGYRGTGERLTTKLPPRPINPYGCSKLFGERAGALLWHAHGIAFVALRIGYCQRGVNLPGPQMNHGTWGQLMWISDRDLCHGFERAILAPDVKYAVLNLMSDNPGMVWDLQATHDIIGYRPRDGASAIETIDTPEMDAFAEAGTAVINRLPHLLSLKPRRSEEDGRR